MPQNPRQQVKQTLQSVMNELERAGQKMIPLEEQYRELHPEYADAFAHLIGSCLDLKNAVQVISDNI